MKKLLLFPLFGCLMLTCLHAEVEADKSLKKSSYKTGKDEEPHTAMLSRYETKEGKLRKLTSNWVGSMAFPRRLIIS